MFSKRLGVYAKSALTCWWLIIFTATLVPLQGLGQPPVSSADVMYRTVNIEGLSIFYRETGPKDAPTLLLLHGLPSSSRMFEPLFARLSDRYHLVAPDYPGFGHTDWPDPKALCIYVRSHRYDHVSIY